MKTSRIALVIAALVLGVVLFALADDYLHSGYVTPTWGTTYHLFTYYVFWSGPMEPPTAYVYIDDLGAVMMDYLQVIDGVHIYRYETTLPSGVHHYCFSDDIGGEDPNGGFKIVGPHVE